VIEALILLPALAAALCFATRRRALRDAWLLGAAASHAALVGALVLARPTPVPGAWLGLDDLGLLFLIPVSALFLAVAVYTVGYLRREPDAPHGDFEEGFLFTNEPHSAFTGCLLLFLATMSLVTASRHLGLLWVAVEGTTLASAPLIYFHRHHRSLEATWKYLLVCSVGIGFALLGNLALVGAGSGAHASVAMGAHASLALDDLIGAAPGLDRDWLEAALLLFLVGYGTKMGLAPMHTWLPDAHSEAPSPVSALLSGALLACAFLGILRAQQVLGAAGAPELGAAPLVAFGLLSMAAGALFIVRQPDYKRMLAYSSVEHMGIAAVGVGIGGGAVFGAMLHVVSHAFAKAALFLVAGNLLARYASKQSARVRGALEAQPRSAALWIAGLLAIAGLPPSALFVSELTILRAAVGTQPWLAGAFLLLLAVAFAAMLGAGLPMALGRAPADIPRTREPATALWPPALLAVALLALGLHLPAPLRALLEGAARALGGG
jgi:hydrogenase-4 component F